MFQVRKMGGILHWLPKYPLYPPRFRRHCLRDLCGPMECEIYNYRPDYVHLGQPIAALLHFTLNTLGCDNSNNNINNAGG